MTAPDDTTEYRVWYDAVDGARRSLNAEDEAGVQQIIADLDADEARRQLLATTVGLTTEPHDYNIAAEKVTTNSTPVDL
jgi:hypothetical protein